MEAIHSTTETTFLEFCGNLGVDVPSERKQWREMFLLLEECEEQEFVEIERTNGKIDTLQLTESGAAFVRTMRETRPRGGTGW